MRRRLRTLVPVVTLSPLLSLSAAQAVKRAEGPAGSVVIVEESPAVPLVDVMIVSRSGAASDPPGREGLANLAAEVARRGAAGKSRTEIDEALDALGANLEVLVDPDAVRFEGRVLARNLSPFLRLVAGVILRPAFEKETVAQTRREVLAQIDEQRSDDRSLCARFFDRRLYGEHPYGQPADGTAKSLARMRPADLEAHFRTSFVGKNMIFAAAGAVGLAEFREAVAGAFRGLQEGPPPPAPALAEPKRESGWRLEIVDKPDRQQTQIMFGHPGLPGSHPDFLPLALGLASFGGRAMKATLMDEVRTKRGLAYGAYMGATSRRGPGPIQGWVYTSRARTVTTLKLVLRLYKQLAAQGVPEERLRFFQGYLAGSFASDMDDPAVARRALGLAAQ